MKLVKSLGSSGTTKMLVSLQESKWERWDIFLILYVEDILFIGNDVYFSWHGKDFTKIVLMKDLGKVAYWMSRSIRIDWGAQ